ncbi:MAG: GTP-binding protein [Lachnospiraceae bacterium]|nr:GTP-binding protein [Lachnospiraceae bacterium]
MVKIDLITGFLGSGKTTFIKNYARYLMDHEGKIAILENDYGAINVDMLMLQELQCDKCDLYMVIGGKNDLDCHRRRLHAKLVTLAMLGYHRVIMEPSGIFDVDELLDMLHEEPLERWYELGSVISIVDAGLEREMSQNSDYLLMNQVADAGKIVFSKSQEVTEQEIAETKNHLKRAMEIFRCDRKLSVRDFIIKDWRDLTDKDYREIMEAGYRLCAHVKLPVTTENQYDSLFYMNVVIKPEEIRSTVERLIKDETIGHIFRVKGIFKDGEEWIEVNATRDQTTIKKVPEGQEVIIVIGENLNQDGIAQYWDFQYGSGRERIDM